MKYLVFGMGGVGASVAERLTTQGKNISVIARGEHLEALQKQGLHVERTYGEPQNIKGFHATTADEYEDTPDVVFICVKEYSINSCYPLLERCCSSSSVVIPLLNVYGTGEKLADNLHKSMKDNAPMCVDGCIYVAAELTGPGSLLESSHLCRIIFGLPHSVKQPALLTTISQDATGSGLECILSHDIRRDALKKFSYVSPMGAAAIIHHSNAGDVHSGGCARQTFSDAIQEVIEIGEAMGINFAEDMVKTNITIAEGLSPSSTTSMQRDLEAGHQSEFDGLINEVIRLGKQYHVPTPTYNKAKRVAFDRFGIR